MSAHWTIISKPWHGYDFLIEMGQQDEASDALPWLFGQVQASARQDFVAAIPQQIEILVDQDELTRHAVAIDLAEFEDVGLTAGDDVTMVCSYADRLGLIATAYRLPPGVELVDLALSAFRQASAAAREAVDFQFLARGALPSPIHRHELINFTAAQA